MAGTNSQYFQHCDALGRFPHPAHGPPEVPLLVGNERLTRAECFQKWTALRRESPAGGAREPPAEGGVAVAKVAGTPAAASSDGPGPA